MTRKFIRWLVSASAVLHVGCTQLLGIDDLAIVVPAPDAGRRECNHDSDCGRDDGGTPAICVEPAGRCTTVQSEDEDEDED